MRETGNGTAGGLPVACHGGAIMTDGPELEAAGLPATEGGRSWFCTGCDPVLMLSGLLTCCDVFPATRKQPNAIQKKKIRT
jgi:hypothetical protein